MKFIDSRRLTGPSLLWERPGAQIDVALDEDDDAAVVGQAWERAASFVLDSVGWGNERVVVRAFPTGMSLALSGPIDALYAAVDVAEAAWDAARELLAAGGAPALSREVLDRLQATIAAERDPRLLALADAARARGVNFCGDDEWTTVGMGAGGLTWPTGALPLSDDIDWERVHDVPSCLVTGTNGKSTTVRMLLSIARVAGVVAGSSSTDRIEIGDEVVDRGDWSGPGGARAVLKDPRVELAVLETARGGLLRRGLGVPRTDVAVITNVAHDHLGEMGVHDLFALTEVKFIVRRAAECLVLCADDPEVRRRGVQEAGPVIWYGLDPADPLLAGDCATVEDGELVARIGGERIPLGPVAALPSCLGGVARHNVRNALGAAAAAYRLGLPPEAIRAGLVAFRSDPATNPGRLNVFHFGGVTALVDFAHNPHGISAVLDMAASLPHRRLGVLLGQAGDRDAASITGLGARTAAAGPDLVIVKRMDVLARGGDPEETVALLDRSLRAGGMPTEAIVHAPNELDGARRLLDWAREGDLLLLLAHGQRDEVLELVRRRSG